MVRQADRLPAAVCVELGMHCLRMDVEALAPVALRLATAPARPSVRIRLFSGAVFPVRAGGSVSPLAPIRRVVMFAARVSEV